jgi:hypothetical protein
MGWILRQRLRRIRLLVSFRPPTVQEKENARRLTQRRGRIRIRSSILLPPQATLPLRTCTPMPLDTIRPSLARIPH